MFPDDEQEIGPLEAMIDDQNHPRLYRNINDLPLEMKKISISQPASRGGKESQEASKLESDR